MVEGQYAERHIMLSVVRQNVVILSVIMLIVVMPNVVM